MKSNAVNKNAIFLSELGVGDEKRKAKIGVGSRSRQIWNADVGLGKGGSKKLEGRSWSLSPDLESNKTADC